MPLQTGSSQEIIGKNIAAEVAAGKPQKQAEAIAFHEAKDTLPSFKGRHLEIPAATPTSAGSSCGSWPGRNL